MCKIKKLYINILQFGMNFKILVFFSWTDVELSGQTTQTEPFPTLDLAPTPTPHPTHPPARVKVVII